MATLCFDLDGTLCSNTFGEYWGAEPFPWAIARVNELARAGHRIVVFTARGTATGIDWEPMTQDQLERWGLSYDELRFGKPSADVYIDDRAVHTEAWRCGDGLRPPGVEAGLPDGALPGISPPRVTAVVELGRTFAGAPLRLTEHVERARALALVVGIRFVPSAREIQAAVGRALPVNGDVSYAICLGDSCHMSYLDSWSGAAPKARVHVCCRHLHEAAAGLATVSASGALAVNATLTPGSSRSWPLYVDGRGMISDVLGGTLCVVAEQSLTCAPTTPPTVTDGWLRELATGLELEIVERPIGADDLHEADEAFIAGVPFCIVPIASVDGGAVGISAPGPVARRLLHAWSRDAGIDIGSQTRELIGHDAMSVGAT